MTTDMSALSFNGFLDILGSSYRIAIRCDEGSVFKVYLCPSLWKLCSRDVQQVIRDRVSNTRSLKELLHEIKYVLNSNVVEQGKFVALGCSQHKKILSELESIGWDTVLWLSDSFNDMTLQVVDGSNRKHKFNLQFVEKSKSFQVVCDLPLENVKKQGYGTIQDAYKQFQEYIHSLQEFWSVMDDIDDNCVVLDPETPTMECTYRRIAIGLNHASLHIEINPNNPNIICECRFFGSDETTTPLKITLNSRLSMWNHELYPRLNIQNILEITFPSKKSCNIQEFTSECGICYSFRIENTIPDQSCPNSQCGRNYHHACVYEWLKSLPTSRTSFGTVFGACPYCFTQMTVRPVSLKV